jgi:hypothetical protein
MKFSLVLLLLFSIIGCKVAKDQKAISSQKSIKTEDSFSYLPSNVELIAGVTSVIINPNLNEPTDYTFTITPSLPTGLTFSTTTGKISGTATSVSSQTIYSITATNSEENLSAIFTLSVIEQLPTAIYYATSPISFTKGVLGTSGAPTVAGGTPTNFSVNPTLPTGLTLNTTTGVISGTPTTPSSGLYNITATNGSGSFTEEVYVTVADTAPTSVSYALSPVTVAKDDLMSVLVPTIGGSPTYKYFSITPKLPSGLILDTTSGVIYGTPTTATGNLTYTVTVSNDAGSATNTIQINVTGEPTSLNYPDDLELEQNVLMTPVLASPTGGKPTLYTVTAGALPPGISLNGSTGSLYGKPTTLGSYSVTITGTNGYGSAAKSVDFEIIEDQPSALNYLSSYTFYVDQVTSVLPNPSGGSPSSYTITPALPAGLALNAATGEISGTPTVYTNEMSYVIQGSNTTGITSQVVNIQVKEQAPTSLGYNALMTFYKDVTTATISPAPTGGTPNQYLITPSLPVGLNFNVLTGEITGSPAAVSSYKTYAIKGWNTGGYKTESVQIKVDKTAPFNFSYAGTTNVINFTLFSNQTENPFVEGSQIISYSINPTTLPDGLSFNTTTGVFSGMPTEIFASTNYIITASNSIGAQAITVSLEVLNIAPSGLTYAGTPYNYTVGTTITDVIPTSDFDTFTGGFIESYSVLPALPGGLTIDGVTGVLSGTPTTLVDALDFIQPTVTYTVTGTNSVSSTTFDIDITVVDEAPDFSYEDPEDGDDEYNVWGSIDPSPDIEPTHYGGDIATNDNGVATDHCSIDGDITGDTDLIFDETTCNISGTPFCGVDDTFTYNITGENSGGDYTTPITINLFDGPDFTYDNAFNFGLIGTGLGSDTLYVLDGVNVNETMITDTNSGCLSANTEYAIEDDLPLGIALTVMTGDIVANNAGMFLRTPFTVTGSVDFTALETVEQEESFELQVNHIMPSDITRTSEDDKMQTVIGDFNIDSFPDILINDFGPTGEQDFRLLLGNGMGSFYPEMTVIQAVSGLLDGEHLNPQFVSFGNSEVGYDYDTGVVYYDTTTNAGSYTLKTQSFNWGAHADELVIASTAVITAPVLKVVDQTNYTNFSSVGSTVFALSKNTVFNHVEIMAYEIDVDGVINASINTSVLNKASGGAMGTATSSLVDFVPLDANNDGYYDLAIAWQDVTYKEICILLNDVNGVDNLTFETTCNTVITVPNGAGTVQMMAGDIVNSDGLIDFVVLDDDGSVLVYRNDGNSFLSSFVPAFYDLNAFTAGGIDITSGYDLTLGHFDSDSALDLAVLDESTNEMIIYYNQDQNFPVPPYSLATKNTVTPFDYFPNGVNHNTNHINAVEIYDDPGISTIGFGLVHCEQDTVVTSSSCGIPALFNEL